jgi:hypothetical protein
MHATTITFPFFPFELIVFIVVIISPLILRRID